MLTLETERLFLRDFSMKDWDALNAILSDPEVTRFMHFGSWNEVKRREWLAWLVQDACNQERSMDNWAMTLRSNGMLIGWFGIGDSRHPSEEGTRGCGYALNRRFWGQGYMAEAARAVFAYEFTVLGTRRILAECEMQNTASARVMQKSGMSYEGTYYDDDFEGNWAMRHRYTIGKFEPESLSNHKLQREGSGSERKPWTGEHLNATIKKQRTTSTLGKQQERDEDNTLDI